MLVLLRGSRVPTRRKAGGRKMAIKSGQGRNRSEWTPALELTIVAEDRKHHKQPSAILKQFGERMVTDNGQQFGRPSTQPGWEIVKKLLSGCEKCWPVAKMSDLRTVFCSALRKAVIEVLTIWKKDDIGDHNDNQSKQTETNGFRVTTGNAKLASQNKRWNFLTEWSGRRRHKRRQTWNRPIRL